MLTDSAFGFFLYQFSSLKMLPSAMQKGIALVEVVLYFFDSQVLDGAGLDVDFHLLSPKGETLVFDERKSDGVHT